MEILGGPVFGVAGAGESHGPAITTIVFGCPPGLRLERSAIQTYLNRRRPGSSKLGTPRRETDELVLLSGLFDDCYEALHAGPQLSVKNELGDSLSASYERGHTTGEPIAGIVLSAAKRSADYDQFAGPEGDIRPGHADLVRHFKFNGFGDFRGGGRSSYRSTISDVVGGSVARIFLQERLGTVIFSSICQVGELSAEQHLSEYCEELAAGSRPVEPQHLAQITEKLDASDVLGKDGIRAWDPDFAAAAAERIRSVRKNGDSVGAAVEIVAVNVPALVGEPLYKSLKLKLMGALGGLHAVQSCEVGSGREVVVRKGSSNNDPIRAQGYRSNHHGGMLGGITTGMPLVCRVGFKPTSSIAIPQESVRKNLEEIEFKLMKGRHDPCVGVRAGITLESRLAIELMNAVLMHQTKEIDPQDYQLFPDIT